MLNCSSEKGCGSDLAPGESLLSELLSCASQSPRLKTSAAPRFVDYSRAMESLEERDGESLENPEDTAGETASDVCIRCTDSIIGIRCYNADITSISFICQNIDDIWQFNISSSHSYFTCEQGGGPFSIKGGVCPTSTTVLPGTSTELVTTTAPPGLEGGAIFGIIVAVIICIILIIGIFVFYWCRKERGRPRNVNSAQENEVL
ncbi:hypothetical protein NDU88_010591 [Pleurodeles waltl]|uniref:Uncharacterized protein n=1 Tax=Pleurodeles waltl TaxID=8319 RepID=A0AAV7PZ72_PLEWA|nr:hypothetical protein NDU88_010591 [Pleurodeles waltl]